MKFECTLLSVSDMEKSLKFYKEIFNQDVAVDLGWNKTLTCGLVLQENFEKIAYFSRDKIISRSHNMEIYFDTEDFDSFLALLEKHPEVELLHEAKTFPWLQRGIRIFDPDGHIIEIGESMISVGSRLFAEGKSVDEVTELTQHPKEIVEEWFMQYKKNLLSLCGTDCSSCYCFGKMCSGCNAHKGKVFHSPDGCAIYECCKTKEHLKDCGKCPKVPCDVWKKTRDPKFSDEEFEKNIAERLANLGGGQK